MPIEPDQFISEEVSYFPQCDSLNRAIIAYLFEEAPSLQGLSQHCSAGGGFQILCSSDRKMVEDRRFKSRKTI